MAEFGRATLRAVTALDAAGGRGAEPRDPFAGQPDGIVTMRNVLPGWACACSCSASCCPRC